MFKRTPVLLGTIGGLGCGVYLTYWLPPDKAPRLADLLTGMVRFALERGCSEAEVIAFAYCGLPLLCAALGAGVGSAFAAGLRVIQKRRAHGGL